MTANDMNVRTSKLVRQDLSARRIASALILMVLLSACGGSSSLPTAIPTETFAPTATREPQPPAPAIVRASPTAPATATLPATATATLQPTATATTTVQPTSTTTPTPPPPTATPEPCPGAIPWDQAREHIGEAVTVIGPVVGATWASESRGKPTFLNIGLPYPEPNRFTILIWIDGRWNFPSPPEEIYLNQTVCVSGNIDIYQGSAEMEIAGPEQIVAVGQ